MSEHVPTQTPHQRLGELVRGIRVVMMTTVSSNAEAHARPMYAQDEPSGEDLWFLTDRRSGKVSEIMRNSHVLLTYSDAGANRYVSVWGDASVHADHVKARELWSAPAQGWFPDGPEDPNLVLIRVRPEKVEYWDGPGMISYSLSLLKALISGTRIEPRGDHGQVALS
jgi:general stress protein 26